MPPPRSTALALLAAIVLHPVPLIDSTARQTENADSVQPELEAEVMVQLSDGSWEPRTVEGTPSEALETVLDEPGVIDASPVRFYELAAPSNPPSDPFYPLQWHLARTEAASAWDSADGSGVIVAVIDSGLSLSGDMGCHSPVSPYDFVTDTPGVPPDLIGHGTFVSAVIAECTDNGAEGAGIAPGARIMPLRVFDTSSTASTIEVAAALDWARTHGADIVNLSMGFACDDPYPACSDGPVDAEIEELVDAGVVVVASSGNGGGASGHILYPANHPDVVAVGASDEDGGRSDYSDFGPGLDLMAPVDDGILHLDRYASGTSFAAPQVAAAVAVLLSAGASSGSSAVSSLRSSAVDVAPLGYDTATGDGELRIYQALLTAGLASPSGTVQSLAGDFDGDDRDDIAHYRPSTGNWTVSRSTGTSFTNSTWTTFTTTSGWTEHLVGDFNGDGRDDIAHYRPSTGNWTVSRSTGTGFTNSTWTTFTTLSGWTEHLVGDFNNDSRDDIAHYRSSTGNWTVSRSTGTGFTNSTWTTFTALSGWTEHLVGDFNNDGRDDIAHYRPTTGNWTVSRSTGTGFTNSTWTTFTALSGWTEHLVGDYNGDGREDIAHYRQTTGNWTVSRSTGTGFTNSTWTTFTALSGWTEHLVGDFNNDSRDDIAHYRSSTGNWTVSRSTGTGFTNSTWTTFTAMTGWTHHLVGDFNNDSRDDIAHYRPSTGNWTVSRSTGTSFTNSTWTYQ